MVPSRRRSAAHVSWMLACAGIFSLLGNGHAQNTRNTSSTPPSVDYFAANQLVGSAASGNSRHFYGCRRTGATLQTIELWANAQFIRGLSVNLTDGSGILFGCVNATTAESQACKTDPNVRNASFSFQPGERVTNLTLWPGYNLQKIPDQRAGAMSMITSQGRSFDFGMTDPRLEPVQISVGSGIPCGVNLRAGADVDALGFVFLLPVTSSTLGNVTYADVNATEVNSTADSGAVVGSNITDVVLSSQVYNNSGNGSSLVASFSSEKQVDIPSEWSATTGLDSYLQSQVQAALPEVTSNSTSGQARWMLGPVSVHNRSETAQVSREWNYTVQVGAGGVSEATARAVQGAIATAFKGNLTVTLSSGSSLTFPLNGTYEGLSISPVVLSVTELVAPTPPSALTRSGGASGGGSSNTLAWVLGVVFGVLGGLIFAALLVWGVIVLKRRRKRSAKDANDKHPDAFRVKDTKPGPDSGPDAANGKGKPSKDVELGTLGTTPGDAKRKPFAIWNFKGKKGKEAETWRESTDPKMGTVVGVPAESMEESGDRRDSDRVILPYVMFRRLRLEAIRNALGLDSSGAEEKPKGETAPQQREGNHEEAGELSNPPSGASTPRAVPVATEKPATYTPPQPVETLAETSSPADATEVAPVPQPHTRNAKLKDRVAAVMALRKGKPEPDVVAGDAMSSAASKSSESKDSSILRRVAKSVSSFQSRGSSAQIQHDDHILDLKGSSRRGPPTAGEGKPRTPRSKPSTPKRPKWIEHEDAELRLGEGYDAPPDARSVQKDTIDLDNKRIKLGVKYDTQGRNE